MQLESFDARDKSTWPEVMTAKQVAEALQVTLNHIYVQCNLFREKGQGLPNKRLGGRVLIPRAEVLKFTGGIQ